MIRFFDYFKESFRYALYSLDYKMFKSEGTKKLDIQDNITVQKHEHHLYLYYTRKLSVDDSTEPTMQTTYQIIFDNVDNMDSNSLSEEEIHEALYDNALSTLDIVAARLSLVTAEVLINAIGSPVILPPRVLKD